MLVTAVEHLHPEIERHARRPATRLLLSRERASVLNHEIDSPAADVRVPAGTPIKDIRALAGVVDPSAPYPGEHECMAEDSLLAASALEVARQGALIPALLLHVADKGAGASPANDAISVDDIELYCEVRGRLLERAACADVPLARAARTEFIAYRERYGDAQHVAVIVAEPNLLSPVTVRIHSACFTGDLFGSLRCDCGEQLAGAVDHMAAHGGGIILYLDQEGRGIGLVNKLRAYRMQASGHDTIDADRHLGFGADGRDFTPALTMLGDLGINKVRLLTNNPNKVAALNQEGIEVVERVPLSGSINVHNERYLETKHTRGGHLASVVEGERHSD